MNPKPKLLLFDIDGTLLSARGIPKRVFLEMMNDWYPDYKNGFQLNFSGLTDPLIVRKILEMNDSPHSRDEHLIGCMLKDFLERLEAELTPMNPPIILPGIFRLLRRCSEIEQCYLGLVTGNMARGAEIKLQAAGIAEFFPVGAFGSDHSDRSQLPPIAVRRADVHFGQSFSKEDTWIIGDSIYDVRCAKDNGLKTLAVATGVTPPDALEKEKPDHILPDLSDTGRVLSIFECNRT